MKMILQSGAADKLNQIDRLHFIAKIADQK